MSHPKTIYTILIWLTLTCISILPISASASEGHSLDSIKKAVLHYVEQQITQSETIDSEISLGRLDDRLKLAQCETALEIFTLSKFNPTGRNNIGVRCNAPHHWKIFVPVTITFFAEVAIAAHPLSRGMTINEGDFRMDRRQITNHHGGYFTSAEELIGRDVRRAVRMGDIIQEKATDPVKLVRKGQSVTLRSGNDQFYVISSGKALSDGSMNSIISVKNNSSGRVVEGTVIGPGVVEIRN